MLSQTIAIMNDEIFMACCTNSNYYFILSSFLDNQNEFKIGIFRQCKRVRRGREYWKKDQILSLVSLVLGDVMAWQKLKVY